MLVASSATAVDALPRPPRRGSDRHPRCLAAWALPLRSLAAASTRYRLSVTRKRSVRPEGTGSQSLRRPSNTPPPTPISGRLISSCVLVFDQFAVRDRLRPQLSALRPQEPSTASRRHDQPRQPHLPTLPGPNGCRGRRQRHPAAPARLCEAGGGRAAAGAAAGGRAGTYCNAPMPCHLACK